MTLYELVNNVNVQGEIKVQINNGSDYGRPMATYNNDDVSELSFCDDLQWALDKLNEIFHNDHPEVEILVEDMEVSYIYESGGYLVIEVDYEED